ncbi:MAG: hypothetical protein VB862_14210, partial [Pirellulaceae bacterium]
LPLLSDKAFGAEAAVTIVGIALAWITLDAAQVLRKKPLPIFRNIFARKKALATGPSNPDAPKDIRPDANRVAATDEAEEIALQPAEKEPAEKAETPPSTAEPSEPASEDTDLPPADDSSEEGPA